jgi:hypothetical protein
MDSLKEKLADIVTEIDNLKPSDPFIVDKITVTEFDTSGLAVNLEKQKVKSSAIPTKSEAIKAQYLEGFFSAQSGNDGNDEYKVFKISNGKSSSIEYTYNSSSSWDKKEDNNFDFDFYILGTDGWKKLPVKDGAAKITSTSDGIYNIKNKGLEKSYTIKTLDLTGKSIKVYGPSEFHSTLDSSTANFPAGSKVFHIVNKLTSDLYFYVLLTKGEEACFSNNNTSFYASDFNGNCNVVPTSKATSFATKLADILHAHNSTTDDIANKFRLYLDVGIEVLPFKGANNSTDNGLFKQYKEVSKGEDGSTTYIPIFTGTWKLTKVHGKELMIFSRALGQENSTFFMVDQGFVRRGSFFDKSRSEQSSKNDFNKVAFDAILEEHKKYKQ